MKNKICSLVLSLVLMVATIGFSMRVLQPEPKKKIERLEVIEAPLFLSTVAQAFWRTLKYYFVGSGGSGKSAVPKPN